MVRRTDGLRNSGIPLGGLGTGSVELRGDGLFHEWQIMNNSPWEPGPEAKIPVDALFFGLQLNGEERRSVVLASPRNLSGWMMEPYGAAWLEHPTEVKRRARFPFTELDFDLGTLPVKVSLEAFSPFIPLDAKHSGLPLAYLTFSIENRAKEPMQSVLATADAWGVLNVDGKTISVDIKRGALKLKTIEVSGRRFEKARVTINKKVLKTAVAGRWSLASGQTTSSLGRASSRARRSGREKTQQPVTRPSAKADRGGPAGQQRSGKPATRPSARRTEPDLLVGSDQRERQPPPPERAAFARRFEAELR